jgi:hypothetical protein
MSGEPEGSGAKEGAGQPDRPGYVRPAAIRWMVADMWARYRGLPRPPQPTQEELAVWVRIEEYLAMKWRRTRRARTLHLPRRLGPRHLHRRPQSRD